MVAAAWRGPGATIAGSRDGDGGAQTLAAMLWATRHESSERASAAADGEETTRLRRSLFWAACIDGVGVEKTRAYFDPCGFQMVPWLTTGSNAMGLSPPADHAGIPAGMPLSKRALNKTMYKDKYQK